MQRGFVGMAEEKGFLGITTGARANKLCAPNLHRNRPSPVPRLKHSTGNSLKFSTAPNRLPDGTPPPPATHSAPNSSNS
ncbi:hypothetical protein QR680_007646 [Steinernema hermaphroditum]|uniref:Uncharacterized protein n=1 Tax=Steinernema hermaphroditum TaxID=289476 RepID=A0AA39IGA4_9BILA|nr:hypothetical protein QR680_007646 [Steinernema hermaphroditum]